MKQDTRFIFLSWVVIIVFIAIAFVIGLGLDWLHHAIK